MPAKGFKSITVRAHIVDGIPKEYNHSEYLELLLERQETLRNFASKIKKVPPTVKFYTGDLSLRR